MDSIKEITKKHFDAYSTQWSQRLTLHCYLYRLSTVASFVPPTCQSIIDFGCGTGDYSRIFGHDKYYLGIDNSVGMIEQAKSLYPSRSFKVSDIDSNGLADDSFDVALAIGVFEYLEDPTRFVEEIIRVVSSGGRLICSFPHMDEKLRLGGSLFARVVCKLKNTLKFGNEQIRAGEPTFSPTNYNKDPRIVHRAYNEESASQLFDKFHVSIVGIKFSNLPFLHIFLIQESARHQN